MTASTQKSGWFASLGTKGIAIIRPPSLIIRYEEWALHWRAGSKLPISDKDDEFQKQLVKLVISVLILGGFLFGKQKGKKRKRNGH